MTDQVVIDSFDMALDDIYGSFKIGTHTFYASDILKSCDPIAYRCDLLDYENTFFGEDND